METKGNKKMSWLFAVAALCTLTGTWLAPAGSLNSFIENEIIRSVKEKLNGYNNHLYEERIYVQTDKPMYEPGDNIWLSVYVREGINLNPSAKSDIVQVELINPKGAVEKKINLIAKNGKAAGDFNIANEAPGGLYKIRAYTNWMKNDAENEADFKNYFEKELQVQEIILPSLKMKLDFEKKAFGAGDEVVAKLEINTNENKPLQNNKFKYVVNLNGKKLVEQTDVTDIDGLSYIKFNLPKDLKTNDGLLNVMIDYNGSTESISRSVPIVLNKISFSLFPEGGDLVYGLNSKVAFKALNEFGKPADVEGLLLNNKGFKVVNLSSYHNGMGAFEFTPEKGEAYHVKITKPAGIENTFKLPEQLDRGYVMNIDNSKNEALSVSINSTETEELSLIAQTRGKIYYSTEVKTKPGQNQINFSTANFPIGVSQITLFDSRGIPRAERLVFVNKDKQMKISVDTDKEKYLPREKVKMTITVRDEKGMPMPANLSMAVVNDQFLSFADDKSGTILSQLLLQQDIKEKIEEPAFYFNNKEPKSNTALDYLLLTSGWRRFTWEKLLEEDLPLIKFPAQKALVSGTVYDGMSGKPLAGVKITGNNGEEYLADEEGKFRISKLELYEAVNLKFQSEKYGPQVQRVSDYNQDMKVYLYDNNYYQQLRSLENVVEGVPLAAMAEVAADMDDNRLDKQERENVAPIKKAMARRQLQPMAEKKVKQPAERLVKEEPAKNEDINADVKAFKSIHARFMPNVIINDVAGTSYYRARQFSSPSYDKSENVEVRTDFRNTIYWNPNLEIGYSGKKVVEFFASDDVTSFRTTLEGMSTNGMIGRTEKNFYTQLPFAMSVKVPTELISGDVFSMPVTLKNNTNGPLGGVFSIQTPGFLKELAKTPTLQTIMPGKAKTIYLDYEVLSKQGSGELVVSYKSCGLSDAVSQRINVSSKGFPQQASFSGQEVEKEYSFELDKMVKGSLKASFTAFPNVVSDLMKGVEGILQEPYGCFEQTSCTAYPNAMVLDYLKNTDSKDNKVLARATDLLDRGYKRLTTFETSTRGYEWFGANPAHEGLTAYGLMEFMDMKRAGQEVDMAMLDRTARWVLSHKDGKGGFEREKRALHDFGRISDDVLNAYIVYALADAGYTDIKKEFESSYNKAVNSKDPYLLAMMANAAYSLKEKTKGDKIIELLYNEQNKDGSFHGSSHSITYSQGASLTIETTALSILAILKSTNKDVKRLNDAVQFLTSTRSGSGVFSSTQGTILALKSLTEYAKFSKRTGEDGTIAIYVDNKKVIERKYAAGDKGEISLAGLEEYIIGEGKHTIKVKYLGVKTPLPYALAVNWNTYLPKSDKNCAVEIKTTLATQSVNVGETVRMKAVITNRKDQEVPSTMVLIGIPAGFTAQAWQLKELQEKNIFDYYEIKGNALAVYYRGLGPQSEKEINLDLKAEVPGEYDAPASSAYLYYTNEYKSWSGLAKIKVGR